MPNLDEKVDLKSYSADSEHNTENGQLRKNQEDLEGQILFCLVENNYTVSEGYIYGSKYIKWNGDNIDPSYRFCDRKEDPNIQKSCDNAQDFKPFNFQDYTESLNFPTCEIDEKFPLLNSVTEIYLLSLAGFIIYSSFQSSKNKKANSAQISNKIIGLHISEYHHAGPINQYFLANNLYEQNLCFIHKKKVDILRSLVFSEKIKILEAKTSSNWTCPLETSNCRRITFKYDEDLDLVILRHIYDESEKCEYSYSNECHSSKKYFQSFEDDINASNLLPKRSINTMIDDSGSYQTNYHHCLKEDQCNQSTLTCQEPCILSDTNELLAYMSKYFDYKSSHKSIQDLEECRIENDHKDNQLEELCQVIMKQFDRSRNGVPHDQYQLCRSFSEKGRDLKDSRIGPTSRLTSMMTSNANPFIQPRSGFLSDSFGFPIEMLKSNQYSYQTSFDEETKTETCKPFTSFDPCILPTSLNSNQKYRDRDFESLNPEQEIERKDLCDFFGEVENTEMDYHNQSSRLNFCYL